MMQVEIITPKQGYSLNFSVPILFNVAHANRYAFINNFFAVF